MLLKLEENDINKSQLIKLQEYSRTQRTNDDGSNVFWNIISLRFLQTS